MVELQILNAKCKNSRSNRKCISLSSEWLHFRYAIFSALGNRHRQRFPLLSAHICFRSQNKRNEREKNENVLINKSQASEFNGY